MVHKDISNQTPFVTSSGIEVQIKICAGRELQFETGVWRVPLFSWFPLFSTFPWAKISAFLFIFIPYSAFLSQFHIGFFFSKFLFFFFFFSFSFWMSSHTPVEIEQSNFLNNYIFSNIDGWVSRSLWFVFIYFIYFFICGIMAFAKQKSVISRLFHGEFYLILAVVQLAIDP